MVQRRAAVSVYGPHVGGDHGGDWKRHRASLKTARMMPSYAQALSTQYADFFYRGTLVMSTSNTSFAMDGSSSKDSPLLWAGAPNVLAVARELDGAYLIAVTIQRHRFRKALLQAFCFAAAPALTLPTTIRRDDVGDRQDAAGCQHDGVSEPSLD